MPTDFHSSSEVITTAIAAFCAAFNLCIALTAWDPSHAKRYYAFLFMGLFFSAAYYCVGEGLMYSGYFRHARFFVPSPLIAGYCFPASILLVKIWFNPSFTLKPSHAFLFVLGVPGTVFTLCSFYLDPTLARELGEAYVKAEVGAIYPKYEHVDTEAARFLVRSLQIGFLHVALMIIGFLAFVGVVMKQSVQAFRARNFQALRGTLLMIAGMLAAISISALFPILFEGMQMAQFGPLTTLPYSYVLYRTMLTKKHVYENLNLQRRLLSNYLPSNLVEDILEQKQKGTLGGLESNGTIMFCDIRNFTAFSEKIPATQLIYELNAYLSSMNKVIHQHGGVINKYIGDEIMVIFGLGAPESEGASKALDCAQHMLKALEQFNKANVAKGGTVFRIGIGLHCGRLVHGNIGDERRMEYTVLGDTVNTAARITGLTSKHDQLLLCSADFQRASGEHGKGLKLFGEFTLRGRSQTTQVFTLETPQVNSLRASG
jgi:class 3 adenylate cyclase